jgi:YD repeat-containing protein
MTVLEDVLNDAAGFAGATRVDLWAPGLRDNSAGTGGVTPQVYSATVDEDGALLTDDIDPGHYKYRVAFNRFIPSQEGELVVPDSVTPVRFVPLAMEFISYPEPVVSDAVAAKVAAEAAADRAEAVEAVQNSAIAGVVTTGATKTALDATYAPAFATTGITYDGSGNVQTVTENGITTTYTYNTDGTVHTDTRAGVTRTYTYDGSGNLTGIAS